MSETACYNPNCTLLRGHHDRCNGPIARDCRHGRLARSCAECEDYEEIASLRERLAAAERRAEEAERVLANERAVMIAVVRRSEAAEARLREAFDRLRWIVDLNHERRIHDYLDSLGSHDPDRCRTCLAARALRSPGDPEEGT